jgi:hypothetical protein
MSFKNNFPKIIKKYNLKMTEDRVQNFRKTLTEIVGVQNGIIPEDSKDLNSLNEKQSWNEDYLAECPASKTEFRNQLLKNIRTSPRQPVLGSFDSRCNRDIQFMGRNDSLLSQNSSKEGREVDKHILHNQLS